MKRVKFKLMQKRNKIEDMIIDSSIDYIKNKIKLHMGTEFISYDYCTIESICKWLYLNAENKNTIIKNLSNLENFKIWKKDNTRRFPLFSPESNIYVKLDSQTYAFVNFTEKGGMYDDDHCFHEKIYLYFFGKNSYKYKNDMLSFYMYKNNPTASEKIMVETYTNNGNHPGYWSVSYQDKRNIDSFFMDEDGLNKLKKQINFFKNSSQFYSERGLNHKLGILIYGAPGTGKSTMSKIICDMIPCRSILIPSITDFKKAMENFGSRRIDDSTFNIILLEDVDYILGKRQDLDDKEKENQRYILNFLDGVNSLNNVIIIATTNHKENLDPALIRKGRFDIELELNGLRKKDALRMLESFKLKDDSNLRNQINESTDLINPSDLQASILAELGESKTYIKG